MGRDDRRQGLVRTGRVLLSVHGVKWRGSGARCKVWSVGCRVSGVECRAQGAGCVQGEGSGSGEGLGFTVR